ncbi:MAG: hypothetical protein DRM98_01550 [Thermoplasmata archaeon]|nr:MAG: hypothetical protein DRM98_01550 [Thermoplasmata archaeon]RLF50882.1 MAG: hypothetical protein DRN24_05840 [Thermoplasmata archaeon]
MKQKTVIVVVFLVFILLSLNNIQGVDGLKISCKKEQIEKNNDETEYWGLLIAVGEYLNHPDQNRPSMLIKVEELYQTLLNSSNWDSNHIKKITAEKATLRNIIQGFLWLAEKEDKNDISLVYITTHGFHLKFDIPPFDEADGKDEALVPYEGFEKPLSFLSDDELNFLLNRLDSKGICVIIDSCYSGGFNDHTTKKTRFIDSYASRTWAEDFLKELKGEKRVVLMSSMEDEVSFGSYFSHFLIKGLQGAADENMDKTCTAEEIFYYAKTFVEEIGVQHPTILDLYPGELPLVILDKTDEQRMGKNWFNVKLESFVKRISESGSPVKLFY